MSLHPLNQEMLVAEVVTIAVTSAGGVALWRSGHPILAACAWGSAALVMAGIVSTAFVERRSYPPAKVLGGFAIALLGAGFFAAVGAGSWWLWTRVDPLLAVVVAIVCLWGLPLGLAAVATRLRERGGDRDG